MDRKGTEQYCICEGCNKQNKCRYYDKIQFTLKHFKDTHLSLNFKKCNEYESIPIIDLVEMSLEKLDGIDEEELIEYFKNQWKICMIGIFKRCTKYY